MLFRSALSGKAVRFALDTNIMAYAEGVDGEDMQQLATGCLAHLPDGSVCVPVQALAELHYVLIRKLRVTRGEAGRRINVWIKSYATLDTTTDILLDASALSSLHQLQIFDAVILASAARNGCDILLSEDMHSGFVWQGCRVMNPFSAEFATVRSQQFS